ncbi:MAG: hypothetical protein HY791_08440 [Deltaproteobacteria bacterium]|nr:hypothetical protein [Deltaproteobacteria bacterium]
MRWTLTNQGGGYYRVDGAIYPGLLLVLREIAESERDDLLRWFAGARLEDEAQDKTWRWIMSHSNAKRGDRKLEELEGYDELVQSFLATLKPEQRLAGLDPKDRLAGLDPKDRLAGLDPKDRLAGLDPKDRLATSSRSSIRKPSSRSSIRRTGSPGSNLTKQSWRSTHFPRP